MKNYNQNLNNNFNKNTGFTIVELMVVLAMTAIILGTAVSNLKEMDQPLFNSANYLTGFFKQVRAKAIGTTSAFKVTPVSNNRIEVSRASSCDDTTFIAVDNLFMQFSKVTMSDTTWSICFSSRGIADTNVLITLADQDGKTRDVEVFLGGAVKLY